MGFTVDVQVGIGGNSEKGIAVSPTGFSGYSTSGLSKGFSFGADVGYTVGIWQPEHDQLGGYAQGMIMAHAVANTGAWYSCYPEEFLGLSFGMGLGVGAEVGEINSVYTHY